MIIKVEACWGHKHYFRLTLPDHGRERIEGDVWDRRTAAQALDLLEHVYHYDRRAIRFNVK